MIWSPGTFFKMQLPYCFSRTCFPNVPHASCHWALTIMCCLDIVTCHKSLQEVLADSPDFSSSLPFAGCIVSSAHRPCRQQLVRHAPLAPPPRPDPAHNSSDAPLVIKWHQETPPSRTTSSLNPEFQFKDQGRHRGGLQWFKGPLSAEWQGPFKNLKHWIGLVWIWGPIGYAFMGLPISTSAPAKD